MKKEVPLGHVSYTCMHMSKEWKFAYEHLPKNVSSFFIRCFQNLGKATFLHNVFIVRPTADPSSSCKFCSLDFNKLFVKCLKQQAISSWFNRKVDSFDKIKIFRLDDFLENWIKVWTSPQIPKATTFTKQRVRMQMRQMFFFLDGVVVNIII